MHLDQLSKLLNLSQEIYRKFIFEMNTFWSLIMTFLKEFVILSQLFALKSYFSVMLWKSKIIFNQQRPWSVGQKSLYQWCPLIRGWSVFIYIVFCLINSCEWLSVNLYYTSTFTTIKQRDTVEPCSNIHPSDQHLYKTNFFLFFFLDKKTQ